MNKKTEIWIALSLTLCCGLSAARAQQPSWQPSKFVLVSLFQGQEIDLPEDFIARLDGGNLKVAVKSFGLSQKNRDREMLVSLIQADGTKLERKADKNGEVTFPNVKEGLAALVMASGQSTYAAMALYATPTAIDGSSSTFELPLAEIDSSIVRSGVDSSGNAPLGPSLKPLSDFASRKGLNRFKVYLQSDGVLLGRVIVPEMGFEKAAGGMNLKFFRNGSLAGMATSADDGTFSVPALAVGMHSVFASGPAGHTAFQFEVLPPKANVVKENEAELPVSFLPGVKTVESTKSKSTLGDEAKLVSAPADELIVLVIPPRLMPGVRDVVDNAYSNTQTEFLGSTPFVSPGLGAPTAGVGAGGGGLGGGGLGGGGLLGIAGLAAGLAAISNEDSFQPPLATTISP